MSKTSLLKSDCGSSSPNLNAESLMFMQGKEGYISPDGQGTSVLYMNLILFAVPLSSTISTCSSMCVCSSLSLSLYQ